MRFITILALTMSLSAFADNHKGERKHKMKERIREHKDELQAKGYNKQDVKEHIQNRRDKKHHGDASGAVPVDSAQAVE